MQAFTTFLLAGLLQIVFCEGPPPFVPDECRGPPPGLRTQPIECCKLPPLFPKNSFEECGLQNQLQHDCPKLTCVFKKHELLGENNKIDPEAMGEHLDKWVDQYPHFESAVALAKERCLNKKIPENPHCPVYSPLFCISSSLFVECPAWDQSEDCTAMKKHLDYCRSLSPIE